LGVWLYLFKYDKLFCRDFSPAVDFGDECSQFVHMEAEPPDDGQLHTLGLLERLRAETQGIATAYDGLYWRVDKMLRELADATSTTSPT
jgi:hypothetical protein